MNPGGQAGLAGQNAKADCEPSVGPVETLTNLRILLARQVWLTRMLKRIVNHPWALLKHWKIFASYWPGRVGWPLALAPFPAAAAAWPLRRMHAVLQAAATAALLARVAAVVGVQRGAIDVLRALGTQPENRLGDLHRVCWPPAVDRPRHHVLA